ncbi:hypothetical protein OCS_00393 [Ophiocordyceps sinensis CO18]|uniref:ubiquitinyl hydrolase 1 n=1 Tax=Ophiocordyceps sinensis (strain Co18 / CGMCC 3.14243) TaxID=911162 RepID=T5AEL0_OPHSC|nr:hypothetical protein OCS_00393 [Ophiocordyceps sinensis CO18]
MEPFDLVFNHLVLPPTTVVAREPTGAAILARLQSACRVVSNSSGHDWSAVQHCLANCKGIADASFDAQHLLRDWADLGPDHVCLLRISEQNAALLIRRHVQNEEHFVIIEVFETSPSAKHVLESDNALEWDFPGRAAQIPLDVFRQPSFQDNLSRFLEQAAQEPLHRFAARAIKAGAAPVESRDTTDPGLLTQFLMPILEATGQSVDTPKLRKRVRDDVNIYKGEYPWRRDPSWLALRVAVQRQLCLSMGNENGRTSYKFLICAVLAQLLKDCVGKLSPDMTLVLRAKLCRRLAKLEQEKSKASKAARGVYQALFDTVGAQCDGIIAEVSLQIENAWDNFKRSTTRRIPLLPSRAKEPSLYLSLPRSGEFLQTLLQQPPTNTANGNRMDLSLPPLEKTAIHEPSQLASRYFKLADLESSALQQSSLTSGASRQACQDGCVAMAKSLCRLLAISAFKSYISKPDQMSIFILKVFELWVEMDRFAVTACPLLDDYHPLFPAEALDVLHLAELSAMNRLRHVQGYLRKRRDNCNRAAYPSENILGEPSSNCFAARYMHEDENGGSLQHLLDVIERHSEAARDVKILEWKKACREYDSLSEAISSGTCACTFDADGSLNVHGCKKCYQKRVRKRMVISAHEAFLPADSVQKSTVVFELAIPLFLQTYRNATWRVLHQLGHPGSVAKSASLTMLLKSYSQLTPYHQTAANGISMASTKKSFLQTHYNKQRMKVDLPSVVLPCGLSFAYYDEGSQSWVSNFKDPVTFQHFCGISIPRALLEAAVADPRKPPWTDGPSSFQTVASQTKCPSHMSVHEFMALQKLLGGKHRRWMTVLTELGSSNVNFSDEETTHLFNQLAIQAGPTEGTDDVLRDAHVIFRDELFCSRLREQIQRRIRMIETNWRESHCMELLITLALRLHALTSGGMRQQAYELLKLARRATLQWNLDLRNKIHNETDANEALRVAQYRFQAALLCRRTFAVFADRERETMDAEELSSFVEASISLQQSLAVDPTKLGDNQKSMLMRDLKTAYRFRSIVRKSVKSNTEVLGPAFCGARSSEPREHSNQLFTPWKFLGKPNDSWIVSVMSSETQHGAAPQMFHYNVIEGHLLIDGQPLGRPPLDIIGSEDVKDLFGDRNLLTYPSCLPGMSHVVAIPINYHEIHFGRRGDKVVIRAVHWNHGPVLLEYIPGSIFRGESDFDLPLELVDGCVHWLNLATGDLEIRRKPAIWTWRPGNWILNVQTRQAKRRETYLVDPHSEDFGKIKNILQGFEKPERITVYQPPIGKLSVELKFLELSFYVNRSNLLECRQLQAEIDPDQDAGTLYGFESKIVLRDVVDKQRRSIIAGLGEVLHQRRGMHVAVRVDCADAYGKFDIDGVLGRLACPPETRLLYSMALFHASTSFPLPDPLTASTGAEEAYRILGSGACQPWKPLAKASGLILKEIDQLCPRREYYPKDKRLLQTVQWNRNLTMEIQHDCYGKLIGDILLKSTRLQAFHTQEPYVGAATEDATSSLQHRAAVRRSLYERSLTDSSVERNEKVVVYESRDRIAGSRCGINVYQTAKILYCRPFKIPKTSLAQILQDIPGKIIGGFHAAPPRGSLDALIGIDIGEQWGSLVNLCRNADDDNVYDAVFHLGLLSLSTKPDTAAIKALCAFSRLEQLRSLQPPDCPLFTDFKYGASPTLERLEELILVELPVVEPQPATRKHRKAQSEGRQEIKRRNVANGLAKHFLAQWPCATPSAEGFDAGDTKIPQAMERVQSEWTRVYNNLRLSEYLDEAQTVLNRHIGGDEASRPEPWRSPSEKTGSPAHGTAIPSLSQELLLKQGPNAPSVGDLCPVSQTISPASEVCKGSAETTEMKELGQILTTFANSSKPLWQQYGNDLLRSHDALRELGKAQQGQTNMPDPESIDQNIATAREVVLNCFALIANALSLNDDRFRWLRRGNLWPRVSPVSLLQQLRSKDKAVFGPGMKELLVFYGTSVTTLQWLLRMRHACRRGDHQKLLEHCSDRGHSNWDPIEFPDWLLLEIESNLLIRREQIEVASAIISPASSANSVLQLNMGRGKTSCIVPMVVAVLADSKQLCRLIVPKALLLQTAQTLQSKIGGLLGREMKHIPFSRRTRSSSDMQQLYLDLHRDVLDRSGVILAIPEHILSYKLSGFQKLADSKLKEAHEMMGIQSWLTKTCRDVLDESDFTLAVKTQLIYPSGQLVPVDGHPDRWKVVQHLLTLVHDNLAHLRERFPQGIEVVERAPGFPMIYIVQGEVEDTLRSRLTDIVCDGHTSILRLPSSSTDACKACLRRVLTQESPDPEDFASLSKELAATPSLFKNALIIRGLLLNGVLFLCLRKRWNVQYGLHPKRDPLAVPFEAKGVPSEQAEFGHPDVAIIFTCLSFYYAGLTTHQFQEGLGRVLKSDDPTSEYDGWTAGCDSLPEALSHWNLINVDDSGQVEKLWEHMRLSRGVLDHYLNNFVFPRYAKQFAVKLQSSGWDLPLWSSDEKKLAAKTTGFSGTNDNRRLLPLTIRQDDLPGLKHTSAEVLTCLLQERNRECMIATSHGARLTEEELLDHLSTAKIRLLIDAGAYILEMDNRSLIKKWLEKDKEAKAGVYFGEHDNRAWVWYRNGKLLPLLATPFADSLQECLVYLDEAHTRGTDLKLPPHARGALTLALGQTKDHTVQAAMRLRQLATTQSVTFCAPPEVYRSILDLRRKEDGMRISSSDVVHWLLEQTCRNNEQLRSLFNAQGIDFCRRASAIRKHPKFLTEGAHKSALLDVIRSPEQIMLDELYGSAAQIPRNNAPESLHSSLRGIAKQLEKYRASCEDSSSGTHSWLMEEVEQEREVEFQVEQVRQVQKPRHYKSLRFAGLHPAISSFVQTGLLDGDSGFESASTFLASTGLGEKYNVRAPGSRLLVSAEFMRTIDHGSAGPNDNFLRPIEWILWGPVHETALVIIPEEAELLIPVIRAFESAPVHLIPYAASTTKNMIHSSELAGYVLPSPLITSPLPCWLSIELGLLGARLYFDFEEYSTLLKHLRSVVKVGGTASAGGKVSTRTSAGDIYAFLLEWLTVRRKGQDIMHTPMGYICQGRQLEASHPFFSTNGTCTTRVRGIQGVANSGAEAESEE